MLKEVFIPMLDTTDTTLNPIADAPQRAPSPPPIPFNADDEDELSFEQRAEMFGQYEESLRSIGEGEIVRGTVLGIDEKEVLVDVGFKSEGVISLAEFADPSSIKVGDIIEVFLEKMENQDGLVVLSKQRADFVRVWDRVKEAHDTGAGGRREAGPQDQGRRRRGPLRGRGLPARARRSRCARCRTSTRCWARTCSSRSSS